MDSHHIHTHKKSNASVCCCYCWKEYRSVRTICISERWRMTAGWPAFFTFFFLSTSCPSIWYSQRKVDVYGIYYDQKCRKILLGLNVDGFLREESLSLSLLVSGLPNGFIDSNPVHDCDELVSFNKMTGDESLWLKAKRASLKELLRVWRHVDALFNTHTHADIDERSISTIFAGATEKCPEMVERYWRRVRITWPYPGQKQQQPGTNTCGRLSCKVTHAPSKESKRERVSKLVRKRFHSSSPSSSSYFLVLCVNFIVASPPPLATQGEYFLFLQNTCTSQMVDGTSAFAPHTHTSRGEKLMCWLPVYSSSLNSSFRYN